MNAPRRRISCALVFAVGVGAVACSSAPTDGEATRSGENALVGKGPGGGILTLSDAWIDGSVTSFQALDGTNVYVLGSNNVLWYEMGSMSNRVQVRAGVRSFQAVAGIVYALDTSGYLYRQNLAGWDYVDANVASFQALDFSNVYVKTTDGRLWREVVGTTTRAPVESNVLSFHVLANGLPYVVTTDHTLWVEPVGAGSRVAIDGSVASFEARGDGSFYVLGTNGNLWNETDYPRVPRVLVDGSVKGFAHADYSTTFVLGTNGYLWREEFNYLHRDSVDSSITAFQPMNETQVYVLHSDGSLHLRTLGAAPCGFSYAPPGQLGCYIQAWAVPSTGSCPDLPAATGTWKPIAPGSVPYPFPGFNGVPNDLSANVPSCHSAIPGACCTYVWWPATTTASQEPSPLCVGSEAVALYNCWDPFCDPNAGCTHPTSGGCDTCSYPMPGNGESVTFP